jgi:hypothetical protein
VYVRSALRVFIYRLVSASPATPHVGHAALTHPAQAVPADSESTHRQDAKRVLVATARHAAFWTSVYSVSHYTTCKQVTAHVLF